MQDKLKRLIISSIIFILLFSCGSYPIFANEENLNTNELQSSETPQNTNNEEEQEKTDGEKELENLQNQKKDLENEITTKEARIGVVEGVLSKTLEEIEVISTKIEEKRMEIARIEAEEISLMKFIEVEEKKLEEYTAKYQKEKDMLEKRLVVMYEMGKTKYLDVLLNSEGISDFLSRYYLLTKIEEADLKLVNDVKKDKEQTENITKSLKENKDALEADKDAKEKYEISLSNMEILKSNKLASLTGEEMALYQEIENYRKEIETIETEIKRVALQNLGKTYIGRFNDLANTRLYYYYIRIWNENTSNYRNI